jgi:hypothetical protein
MLAAVTDRLGFAADILAARASLSGDVEPRRRVLLGNRIGALRARLLGDAPAAGIDMRDPMGSLPAFTAELQALRSQSPLVRAQRGEYLAIIGEQMYATAAGLGLPSPDIQALTDAWQEAASLAQDQPKDERNKAQMAQYLAEHEEWARSAGDRAKVLAQAMASANSRLSELGAVRLNARNAAAEAAIQEGKLAVIAYLDANIGIDAPGRGATIEEREAKRAIFHQMNDALMATYVRAGEQWEAENPSKEIDETKATRDAVIAMAAKIGQEAVDRALAASPVSEEAAQAWAAAQDIPKSAANQLEGLGYPVDKVRADMAEFYRLTGGRLPTVRFKATDRKRAYASDIHGHNTSTIALATRFDKRVLFHELAHHLEADPSALAAARGFLVARREGDKLYRLKDLVPRSNYGASEVAFKDGWVSPYVGKVYGRGTQHYMNVTEVFSMGVEAFSDPAVLAERMAKDPQHTAMVLGYMTSPVDPLFDTVKQVLARRHDAEEGAKELHADEVKDTVSAMARAVAWDSIPAASLDRLREVERSTSYWYMTPDSGYECTPIGRYGDVYAFNGKKLRDRSTGRRKRGIVLIRHSLVAGTLPGSEGKKYDNLAVAVVFAGEQMAKATAAAWARMPEGSQAPTFKNLGELKQAASSLAQPGTPT